MEADDQLTAQDVKDIAAATSAPVQDDVPSSDSEDEELQQLFGAIDQDGWVLAIVGVLALWVC